MSENNESPCDISANQYNDLFKRRLVYLQSSAVTFPPNYGKSNVHPSRATRCKLQYGQKFNFNVVIYMILLFI